MAELGKAYLTVVPSMRGGASNLQRELTRTTSSAGGPAGRSFMSGFGKTAIRAVGAMGIATGISSVFSKGFARMTAIDNAKAKLTALGNSAKDVKTISDNAMAAVKGTAFGMDAAMTTAASATAAGIKPGKELSRYLTLVGDAAAVAGVDMGEMGSIFNKVAANGKVTTEEMNQLADRGIPIWKLLANETGMSMDDLRSAIQEGKVDIDDFQNAIEKGMGGAAKTIGSTTITGAISNLNASISRIGANMLGSADDSNSFAGKLLPLMNQLMGFMGKVESGASVIGQVIASIIGPIMEGLGTVFTELANGTGQISPLKDILLGIGQAIGQLVAIIMPILVPAIRLVFNVLGIVLTRLRKIWKSLQPIINIVKTLVTVVVSVATRILNWVSRLATSVAQKLSFAGLVGKVRATFNRIKEAITKPFNTAKEKVKELVNKIKGFFPISVGKIIKGILPDFSIGKKTKKVGGKTQTVPNFTAGTKRFAKAMSQPYMFDKQTMFAAGEAGDEMLYGRSALLTDIANAVRGAGGSGGTLSVVINLDGRTIGQSTVDYINSQTLQFGVSPVMV